MFILFGLIVRRAKCDTAEGCARQELDHRPRGPRNSIPAQGSCDYFVGTVPCHSLYKRRGCCWYAFNGAPSLVLPTAWVDP